MSTHRRNRSSGSESALVMIVLAVIAMPVLAICLLCSENKEEKDWGYFFAFLSVFLWIPVFFMTMFG